MNVTKKKIQHAFSVLKSITKRDYAIEKSGSGSYYLILRPTGEYIIADATVRELYKAILAIINIINIEGGHISQLKIENS